MKKRIIITGLALLALTAIFVTVHTSTPSALTRPLKLVITGSEGQRFTGSYVVDGITNSLSAAAPATVSLQARDVTYEFHREGGNAEFRVALYVEGLCRTSTTSDKRQGVHGELRYAAKGESYWATGF